MHSIPTVLRFPQLAAVAIAVLMWNSIAYSGEIHEAAANGDVQKVMALLKANPELLNAKTQKGAREEGSTPLHEAAGYNHKYVVELLLFLNADVNAKTNNDGYTALHVAVAFGYKDIVELLLAHDADVNAEDTHGRTALHWAAYRGNKEVAKLLLGHRTNLNAKENNYGWTPLLMAVLHGKKEIVELLLANNADANVKGKDGKSPLRWALDNETKDIAELLRVHGGKE